MIRHACYVMTLHVLCNDKARVLHKDTARVLCNDTARVLCNDITRLYTPCNTNFAARQIVMETLQTASVIYWSPVHKLCITIWAAGEWAGVWNHKVKGYWRWNMDEFHDIIYRTANLVPTKCSTRCKKGRRRRNTKAENTTRKKGQRRKQVRKLLHFWCVRFVTPSTCSNLKWKLQADPSGRAV